MDINSIIEAKPNPNIPPISPGDTVKVTIKIREGDKERLQPFQGIVIRVRNHGVSSNFTVRQVVYGIGVERTFPLYSPLLGKVEILSRGRVRRAKLYYLRELSSKQIRAKIKTKVKEPEETQKT